MAARTEYQIVGRYMNGKEVTGYHLQSVGSGKEGRYTKEQVCYLVGRDQVSNCSGQIYQDKVLLRGVGITLDSLPVQQENGELKRTESVGKVRSGDTAADVMNKLQLKASIVNGRNVIGYIVANSGGGTKNASRAQILELAKAGKLGNARYQESNGKPILRGVGVNLNELPSVTAESLGLAPAKAPAKATDNAPKNIEKFRSACIKTGNAITLKVPKISIIGFNEIDSGSDVLDRFDFSINSKNFDSGMIELFDKGVLWSILRDGEAKTLSTPNTNEGFTAGWKWVINQTNNIASATNNTAPKTPAKPKESNQVLAFRSLCNGSLNAIRKQFSVITGEGFSGKSDYYEERFDFAVNGDSSIGGFIELFSGGATFNMMTEDGDVKTINISSNNEGFMQGWKWAIRILKSEGTIR